MRVAFSLYDVSVSTSAPVGMPSPCSISSTVSQPSMNGHSGKSGCSMWAESTIRYAAWSGWSITKPEVREW